MTDTETTRAAPIEDGRDGVELTPHEARIKIQSLKDECRRLTLQLRSEHRRAKADAERQLEYRLGEVINENRRRPWRWPLIPIDLYKAACRYRQDQQMSRMIDPAIAGLLDTCRHRGAEAAVDTVWQDPATPEDDKLTLLRATAEAAERGGDYDLHYAILKAVQVRDPSVFAIKLLFRACEYTWRFKEAAELIDLLEARAEDGRDAPSAKAAAAFRKKFVHQLSLLRHVQERRPCGIEPVQGRIAYVLHNSLPHSSGGYATRSHGVATGFSAAGLEVVAFTRPGFPIDIKAGFKGRDVRSQDEVGTITYERIFDVTNKEHALVDYVLKSADALEKRLREQRPSLVIGASNYRVGLMAMIAARRLGIPFVYEVRGWWEVTRASRDPSFEFTDSYQIQRLLEYETAKAADHVLTLTEGMREDLEAGGVPPERIALFPNSCDAARFEPMARDQSLAARYGIPEDVPVIGYIGTFVDYEGLDDLARACVELKRRGVAFRLLIVGNENVSGKDIGPIAGRIQSIMTEGDAADWLLMPGRVPYEEVAAHYSLLDIAAFPRKPWTVCELVSPMKPLEAMAMEKTVVVSNVRALCELVQHDVTGLTFAKGDSKALADALHRLIADRDLATRLAAEGRRWVLANRTWERSAAKVLSVLPFAGRSATPDERRGAA
ncbi:MAG: glycosyltransferase family 4 protein [Alphaproteobacteria bacterium]